MRLIERLRARRWRVLASLVGVLALMGAGAYGWRSSAHSEGPAPRQWVVSREDVSMTLELVGVVESARIVNLSAPFDGMVTEKHFLHNQRVNAGDALLKIDASELTHQRAEAEIAYLKAQEQRRLFDHLDSVPDISRARRSLMLAQAGWSNARKKAEETAILFEKGIVSRNERDDGEEQARQQSALVKSAEEELASALERFNTVQKKVAEVNLAAAQQKYQALLHAEQDNPLKAPISGVALVSQPTQGGQTPVERGSRVTRGQHLLSLIDPDHLAAAFKVDEVLVRRLAPGQEMMFHSDVLGQAMRGKITFIAAQASPVLSAAKSAEFDVRAALTPEPPASGASALVGSTGKVTLSFLLWKNAMVVPVSFVHPANAGQVVYVQARNRQQSEARTVQTGHIQDGRVELRSGVTPGETLVEQPF